MDVMTVADQLRGDLVAGKDGARQSRIAMRHGTHAIEQVSRVTCARGNGFVRLLERRAGMAERYAYAAGHEGADQLDAAIDLRGDRDNGNVRAASIDGLNDVAR